jgi:Ca2+/Na+ antiporter
MNELLKNKYVIFSLFLVVLFVIMNYLLKVKFMTSAILSFLLATLFTFGVNTLMNSYKSDKKNKIDSTTETNIKHDNNFESDTSYEQKQKVNTQRVF